MNTTEFNFDEVIDRRGTDCVKWDTCYNENELPLWVADMDFKTAPAIIEALRKRVEHGIFGYTVPGNDYYDTIHDWFLKRHDWDITREQIIYTTGVVPATSAVIKGLTEPGDGVVIMTPVYTCFFSSIRNNGCQIIESPLKMIDRRYEIDFENLEEKLSGKDAKILLLCNPHNPGGRVWTRPELEKVNELCVRHDVIILSDEIHNEITMPGFKYTPVANVATGKYVSMVSSSKSFNTAGLHIANIVTPFGELRAKIDRAVNINETCDVGPMGVTAMIAAYRDGLGWLEAMIAYVFDNYNYLCSQLSELKDVEVMKMEGSYLAWLDVKRLGMNVADLCERLRREADVRYHPGTAYGADGEGYIRINLATSRSVLSEAIIRFKNWLRKNSIN